MGAPTIALEDPRTDDVRRVATRHLEFARATTPPEDVHALDASGLEDPQVSVFGVRADGELVAVGALRELDPTHGELKAMHTVAEARGFGHGERLARHIVDEARRRGYGRVSLETGSQDAFAAARALYAKVGFEPCGPFANYPDKPGSAFMTLRLVSGA